MKHIISYTAIVASFLLASCGSSDKDAEATQSSTTDSSTQTTTQPAVAIDTNSSAISAPIIPTNTSTGTIQPGTASNTALNPEHGKPGHRCDIAVGAPLNSKPTAPAVSSPTITTSTPTNVSQPAVVSSPASATNNSNGTKSSAGINPAHGQPGHRCDIAVGAPLDSKPVQASIQQPATVSTPSTPAPKAALPYTPVTTQAATPTAKGMNPAHGQPGHRCDIAVGAPLDSKPTTPTLSTESAKPKQ